MTFRSRRQKPKKNVTFYKNNPQPAYLNFILQDKQKINKLQIKLSMDPIPKLFRFASPIIVDGIKQERFIIRSDGALGHFYFPPDEKHLLSCEDKTCPGKAMAIYGAEGGEVKLKKKHKKNCLGRSTDFDSSMISSVVHGVRERADWAINHVRMMPDELKSKIRIHINVRISCFPQ